MFRLLLALALVTAALNPNPAHAFDPINDDISGFILATAIDPDTGRPEATLELSARQPDGTQLAHTFALRAIEPTSRAPKGATYFYALDPADKARLDAARAQIAQWKKAAPGTQGSLSFTLDLGVANDVRGSLWVSPRPGARYQQIMKDQAIS